MKGKFEILFEDEYIIIINKSAPFLTLPDRYSPDIKNLQSILKDRYESIYTLHRLDKGTSGVILFAKDAESHKILSGRFHSNEISKIYEAVTYGFPKSDSFEVDAPLIEDKNLLIKVDKKGKPSRTSFKLISKLGRYAHLEAQLHTGRTHQIRVHLNHIGLPLAVDQLYGYRSSFVLSHIKKNYRIPKGYKERPLMSERLSLHATSISFLHPKSNELVTATAPLPKAMKALIYQLNKWSGDA